MLNNHIRNRSKTPMTHTQLTTHEAALIHGYLIPGLSVSQISRLTHRSRPTIYRIKHWIDTGKTLHEWALRQQELRRKRGRYRLRLSNQKIRLVKRLLGEDYNPDVIAHTYQVGCSGRTLYRMVSRGVISVALLPWKGKRRSNHACQKRGRI